MPARPFLYLPDALSLMLLFLILTLLRRSAIAHLRQELLRLRKEMIVYWSGSGLQLGPAASQELRARLVELAELAPRLSPARLFFINRLVCKGRLSEMLPSAAAKLARVPPGSAENPQARLKLQRLHLEMNLAVGTFFLMGSISGWILLCSILIRLGFRKVIGRPAGAASVFDFAEKLISRIGVEALKLARFANGDSVQSF